MSVFCSQKVTILNKPICILLLRWFKTVISWIVLYSTNLPFRSLLVGFDLLLLITQYGLFIQSLLSWGATLASDACSIIEWFDNSLLGNEDTIEEFSLILFADFANLGDFRAAEGEGSVVDSIEDQLVLILLGELNSASWVEVDEMTLLSSEVVFDFNLLLVFGDDGIDWEMGENTFHSISETL